SLALCPRPLPFLSSFCFFFCSPPAPTQFFTLSLHDALPIYPCRSDARPPLRGAGVCAPGPPRASDAIGELASAACPPSCSPEGRSEEHTSELQSRENLVCRLLLEKKNERDTSNNTTSRYVNG